MLIQIEKMDGDIFLLGTVSPPTQDGKDLFTTDPHFLGKRQNNGQWANVHDVLDEEWSAFCKTEPDSDDEFIPWLENKGWKQHETTEVHTVS